MAASRLDLYLKIDSLEHVENETMQQIDKSDFPILNYHFYMLQNSRAHAYLLYISHLIRYSRVFGSFQNFLDRELLLAKKLLKQGP